MAAETILTRDAKAVLNFAITGRRPARNNFPKDYLFLPDFEPHDPPRNLRLVGMRQNLEAGSELCVGDHVRAHIGSVIFSGFWPAGGRLAIHLQDQHGMMRCEV